MVEQQLREGVMSVLSRLEDLQDVTVCGAVDIGPHAQGLASQDSTYNLGVVFCPDNPFQYAFLDDVSETLPNIDTTVDGYHITIEPKNTFDVRTFAQNIRDETNISMRVLASDFVYYDSMGLEKWRGRVNAEANLTEIVNGYRKMAMSVYRNRVQRQVNINEPNKTGLTQYAVDEDPSNDERLYLYTPGDFDPDDYERVLPHSRVGPDSRAEIVSAEQTIEGHLLTWHGLLSAVYVLEASELPPTEFRTLTEEIRDISDVEWDEIPTEELFNWSVKQRNGNGDEVVGNHHQRVLEGIETEILNRMRKKKYKRHGVDKDHLNRLIQMTFQQSM